MESMTLVFGLVCGASIASLVLVFFLGRRHRMQSDEFAELKAARTQFESRLAEKESLLAQHATHVASLQDELETLRETFIELKTAHATLQGESGSLRRLSDDNETLRSQVLTAAEALKEKELAIAELDVVLKKERENHREKLELLDAAKKNLSAEFENLANRILEEKSKKFSEQNKVGIEQVLSPLKTKIETFKKTVEDTYEKGTRDRIELRTQIEALTQSNRQISDEATRLAQALKGQSQTQGAWGEMILEMVLEKSGLSAGREYTVQQSITTDEGRRFRPDVVVHLPNERDIVIDAKVSLTAYERFFNEKEVEEKERALKAHVASIQQHIKDLSGKSYHELEAVRTLDYVLLFIPIEGAYSSAIQEAPTLIGDALERNVIIVTPSTLLLALRTVENIWRYERQNTNAVEIARRAGALYDKFVGFVTDLEKVTDHLRRAQKSNEDALSKLHRGRGNLVRTVDQLKKMGAKAQKQLDERLVERADEEDHFAGAHDTDVLLKLSEETS